MSLVTLDRARDGIRSVDQLTPGLDDSIQIDLCNCNALGLSASGWSNNHEFASLIWEKDDDRALRRSRGRNEQRKANRAYEWG